MKARILNQLKEMGINKRDTVLVHSSMKSIGGDLSPEEVIDLLKAAVGEEGTLLMPALTYKNVRVEEPVFDSGLSMPCIGLLPRTFFKSERVVRSVHPTHSVCAWGKNAVEITDGQEKDQTPVGKNSPYMKIVNYNGKLLFIGEVLHACTFMHGVEEVMGSDYVLTKDKIRYIVNGKERFLYGHNFRGWCSEYQKVKNILSEGELIEGKFGNGVAYVIDATALLKRACELMTTQPHYFVTA